MSEYGQVQARLKPQGADALFAAVEDDGSVHDGHLAVLLADRGADAARNQADAVHFLALLHGRHPGLVDHAAWRAPEATRQAFERAADWFDGERALLTKLVVAVGPMPGTPGQAESEGAVLAQRHALETLGRSERPGCAAGAVAALATDWLAIRPLLDLVAERLFLPHPNNLLPVGLFDALLAPVQRGEERARLFGAQQVANQHRGLWQLLASRAVAREDLY